MESKNLKILQLVARIGKVLSEIVKIACIVGAALCFCGILGIGLGNSTELEFGGMRIHGLIEESSGLSVGTMYASMTAACLLCLGEILVAAKGKAYFTHELAAGDPFTFEGAGELQTLGIYALIVPIVSGTLASVAYAVLGKLFADVAKMDLQLEVPVSLGLVLLLLSVLCRYGAECKARAGESVHE